MSFMLPANQREFFTRSLSNRCTAKQQILHSDSETAVRSGKRVKSECWVPQCQAYNSGHLLNRGLGAICPFCLSLLFAYDKAVALCVTAYRTLIYCVCVCMEQTASAQAEDHNWHNEA